MKNSILANIMRSFSSSYKSVGIPTINTSRRSVTGIRRLKGSVHDVKIAKRTESLTPINEGGLYIVFRQY